MKWYLRACPVCYGDLHDDYDDRDWLTCFLCARSFSAKDLLPVTPVTQAPELERRCTQCEQDYPIEHFAKLTVSGSRRAEVCRHCKLTAAMHRRAARGELYMQQHRRLRAAS